MAHTQAKIDKALALYEQGLKITEIEQRTGVQRASLYHYLRKRRMKANRLTPTVELRRQMGDDADITVEFLTEQLLETQRRLAAAEAALAAIRTALESTDR